MDIAYRGKVETVAKWLARHFDAPLGKPLEMDVSDTCFSILIFWLNVLLWSLEMDASHSSLSFLILWLNVLLQSLDINASHSYLSLLNFWLKVLLRSTDMDASYSYLSLLIFWLNCLIRSVVCQGLLMPGQLLDVEGCPGPTRGFECPLYLSYNTNCFN